MNEFYKAEQIMLSTKKFKINQPGAITFEFVQNGRRSLHAPFAIMTLPLLSWRIPDCLLVFAKRL